METGRPTIPKASPRTLAVTRVDGSPVWSDVRRTRSRRRWPALGRRGASGLQRGRWWMRSSRGSGSCCGAFPRMPATANRGADRLCRSDSLIEFVKTKVAILALLILTATTTSDEPSYRLNDTGWMVSGSARIESRPGRRPLADTLASIMDSAPNDGTAACAEEGRGINCK